MSRYVLIEGEFSLRPDWKEFVKAPEAPSNYKKPEVIAEYIRAKMETLEEEVRQNCPSLLTVRNVLFACQKDLGIVETSSAAEAILLAMSEALQNNDRLLVIGEKQILNAYVAHPSETDSFAIRDLREAVWNGRVTCCTLEDFRFTSSERKMLITDKLMRKDPNEDFIAFAMRNFSNWGIVYPDEWVVFRE